MMTVKQNYVVIIENIKDLDADILSTMDAVFHQTMHFLHCETCDSENTEEYIGEDDDC